MQTREKVKASKWILGVFVFIGGLSSACSSNLTVVKPTDGIVTNETKVAPAAFTPSPTSLQPAGVPTSVNSIPQVVLFDDWPTDGFPSDAAKIRKITLDRNILKIHVVYQGGCQEHTFALYAWTGFLLSNPPQGELYLSQDAQGDTCTENMATTLLFDLTPLDQSRAGRQANPLILRIYEPGSFANEPYMPLIEWP